MSTPLDIDATFELLKSQLREAMKRTGMPVVGIYVIAVDDKGQTLAGAHPPQWSLYTEALRDEADILLEVTKRKKG